MPDILNTVAPSGPQELLRLKEKYLFPCVFHFYQEPPQIVRADDCYLIDHTGKHYLDAYSGVTVTSAGHCNPTINEAVIEQIRTLDHTTSIYLTEPMLRLAEQLAQIAPGQLQRSFFCASGSEATEGAMLTAALHTGRPGIAATTHGLHGRTRWAINATGLEMWRTDPNPLPAMHHVPFNDADALEKLFQAYGQNIAAFIVEPIQGNGGIQVPDDNYLPRVRNLCDQYGVLLILDEIQTGFNRTGQWFACQHANVTPDIIAVSKAIANGYPIAAWITTDAIAKSYTRPGASTYGGNPIAATAALATIQFHATNQLGENAKAMGAILTKGLQLLADQTSTLQPPRGKGLMIGLPIVNNNDEPDSDYCDLILNRLKDRGVLAGKTGPDRNVLTFMPPLTINVLQIGDILDAVESSL